MANQSIAMLPAKLYELLEPLSPEERSRVVQATFALFGDFAPGPGQAGFRPPTSTQRDFREQPTEASAYFDSKAPQNKGELLAVAARYRETMLKAESHSKSELKDVIASARRNFDQNNFARDINNAKRQAGFFNLGTGRGDLKLSYYGQQFVDALPDREAAERINRPRVGGVRKKNVRKQNGK